MLCGDLHPTNSKEVTAEMNAIDDDKDIDYEEGSFMDRIKESPRTVSALIIILIVAAAIYAFSGDDQTQPAPGVTDQGAITTEQATASPAAEESTETATTAESSATGKVVTQEELQTEVAKLPEPRKTNDGYVEVAQAGEGITHLSRRALTRWLTENQAGYTVTNEHRIYIEDYIQNKIGTHGLSLGAEQTISFDLIKEAVSAAQQLNDRQLKNLSQYTYVLT